MTKKLILSISILGGILLTPTVKALTLDDIYFLLNSEFINPTQASILMQNSYMFGGPTQRIEDSVKTTATELVKNCVDIT